MACRVYHQARLGDLRMESQHLLLYRGTWPALRGGGPDESTGRGHGALLVELYIPAKRLDVPALANAVIDRHVFSTTQEVVGKDNYPCLRQHTKGLTAR